METIQQNKKITWILIRVQVITVLVFATLTWLIIPEQFRKEIENDAVLTATIQVEQIKQLRTYYSEYVLSKVMNSNADLIASHDHKNRENTIPIPASFIHDIGDFLDDRSYDLKFYSPYPFSNRHDRKMDNFGTAAWSKLSTNPREAFTRSEIIDNKTIIRIAIADTMSKRSCINCHNSHHLSTKTDWELDDLRGILEISKDITHLIESGKKTGRYLALALIIIFGSMTLLSYKQILKQIGLWSNKLAEREQDLKEAQSIAHIGSWNLDILTNRLYWTNEIYNIFGIDKNKFKATYEAFIETIHPDDRTYVIKQYEESLQGKTSYDIEHRIVRKKDGKIRWVHEKCSHQRNSNGEVIKSSGTVQDITDRKQVENEIKRLAMTDQLTGLANRNRFHQRFEENISLAQRENFQLALLLLDLDKFKYVNDTFGHIVGDELLVKVAEIFKSTCRKTDLVARLGGDEFAIILVHPDNTHKTEICANRIIQKISQPLIIKENTIRIGVSIGISMYPENTDVNDIVNEEDSLIHKADVALYNAKNAGRNRLCFYSPELENED